jgi:hypothetical protein
MNSRHGLFYLFLLLGPLLSWGQEYPRPEIDIERFVEELFAIQDEDIDYEDLYENLLLLYTHPLNINTATEEELRSLYLLSQRQLESLRTYIQRNGPLVSVYELQAVPDFDLKVIYRLMPFVVVKPPMEGAFSSALKNFYKDGNNLFLWRYERTLQEKRGYSPIPEGSASTTRYLGSPDKLYARFRSVKAGDYSFGFTLEKDQGEQITWDPSTRRYLADFQSFHFQLQNRGRLKNLVLGDFMMQTGQHLVLGPGFAIGKGAETVQTIRRSHLGIRPYTSVLESGFMRGVAATLQAGHWQLTPFISHQRVDGVLALADSGTVVTSFPVSGFHRTPSELRSRRTVWQTTGGANLHFRSPDKKMHLGLNGVHTLYDIPMQRRPNLYNGFEFNGANNTTLGAYGSYTWENINFFGEAARSSSGGTAMLGGMLASLSAHIDLSILARHYERDFHTFYGNAFGETTRNINERGVYWGLKYSPSRKWVVTGYFDKFAFPWMRARIYAPSSGHEYLSRISYLPNRKTRLFFQIREKVRDQNNATAEGQLFQPDPGRKRNYIAQADYPVEGGLEFSTRVQASDYRFGTSFTRGFAIMQDFSWRLQRFKFSGRFAMFDTEDFDNRQYAYEADILYAFSIPAYNGQGIRSMLLVQYKAGSNVTFWLRYANTRYTDRNIIGSGLELIEGNQRTDIKFQTRITF